MRRFALPAVALLAVVTLSACGSATASSPSASGSTATTGTTAPPGSLPTVQGGVGQTPTVTIPSTDPPTDLTVKVLHKGTGAPVGKGDTMVVNYVGELWKDGSVFDSSFRRGQPMAFEIGTGKVIPGWDHGLVGKRAGSRVLLVLPPDQGYGPSGNPQAGIAGDDTLVFVVDVLGSFAATDSAHGTPTPVADDAVPQVTVNPGRPTITVPPGAPSPKLIAVPVVTGTGPTVSAGDLLVVQYVGVLWRTGKVFDSSWSRGAPASFGIGVQQVIAGLDKGLVGKKVGSRVLLVIPPSLGYGSAGQPAAGIKGTDTMVFAVDILGAFPGTSPSTTSPAP